MVQNLKKISAYLFVLRMLRTVLSVVTVSLAANFFGIGIERDIWLLVSAFILTVNLAIWGPINETFRTKFVFLREQEGEMIALRKTASLFSFVIWGTLCVCALVWMFPEFFMNLIAPSVGDEEKYMFVRLLRFLLPTFLINELTILGIGLLNAYESFYVPEIVSFFSGVIQILCLLLLAPIINIYSLVVSMYLGYILLLLVLIYFLCKKKIQLGRLPFFFSWKEVWPFVKFSIPFFIPYFASQCNVVLEKSLANLLGTGIVSVIDYSRRFSDVLLNVFLSILTSVLVPVLSKYHSSRDQVGYRDVFRQYVQIVFLILLFVIPLLVGAALPIDRFFFHRGDITMEVVQNMAILTQYYGISFIAVALYLLFGLSLLSQNQGKKYAFYGAFAQVIMIGLNMLLYRKFGVYTFAITLFASHLVMAIVMYSHLRLLDKKVMTYYICRYLLLLLLLVVVQTILGYYLLDLHVIWQLLCHSVFLCFSLPLFAWLLGFDLKQYIILIKTKIG